MINYWEGRVAVITGATHGIGLRLVERLAEKGVKIATIYRDNDEQAEKLKSYLENLKVEFIILKGDITHPNNISNLVATSFDKWGRIDFLINNIGNDTWGNIFDLSIEDWMNTEELLLNVPFRMMKECLPIMRKQGFGRIINVGASSKNYMKGQAGLAPFGIFKGALNILSQTLALEEISHGITVNVVAPGSTSDSGIHKEEDRIPINKIPIGRRISRDEVTEAMLYFLSENSGVVTGQFIGVNGGCSV
jgi:3-oxoacyl-[acyl-carrier protein] reductase